MCSAVLFLGVSPRVFAIGEQVENDKFDYARAEATETEIQLPDGSLNTLMSGWVDIAEFSISKAASSSASYDRCSGISPCVSGAYYFQAGSAWVTLPGAQWQPFMKFTPQEVNVGDGKAWVSAYVAGNKKVVLHREEKNVTSGNLAHHTSNKSGTITVPLQPTTAQTYWEGLFQTADSKCGANAQGRCIMRDATYFDATSDFTIKVAIKFTKMPTGISKSYTHNINVTQLFEFGHTISDVSNHILGTHTAVVTFSGGVKVPERCLISSNNSGELRFNDIAMGAGNGLFQSHRVRLNTTCTGLASTVNQYIKVTRKSGIVPVDQRYQIFTNDKDGNPALSLAMKIIPGGVVPPGLGAYCTEAAGNYNVYGTEYLVTTQGGMTANPGTQTRYDLIDFALCKTGIPANYGEYTIPITITTRWSDK